MFTTPTIVRNTCEMSLIKSLYKAGAEITRFALSAHP